MHGLKSPAALRTGRPPCQVPGCTEELPLDKAYYVRSKVCPSHSQAPVVVLAGRPVRWCNLCRRFQELEDFDGERRSCRSKLDKHNARRRKNRHESVRGPSCSDGGRAEAGYAPAGPTAHPSRAFQEQASGVGSGGSLPHPTTPPEASGSPTGADRGVSTGNGLPPGLNVSINDIKSMNSMEVQEMLSWLPGFLEKITPQNNANQVPGLQQQVPLLQSMAARPNQPVRVTPTVPGASGLLWLAQELSCKLGSMRLEGSMQLFDQLLAAQQEGAQEGEGTGQATPRLGTQQGAAFRRQLSAFVPVAGNGSVNIPGPRPGSQRESPSHAEAQQQQQQQREQEEQEDAAGSPTDMKLDTALSALEQLADVVVKHERQESMRLGAAAAEQQAQQQAAQAPSQKFRSVRLQPDPKLPLAVPPSPLEFQERPASRQTQGVVQEGQGQTLTMLDTTTDQLPGGLLRELLALCASDPVLLTALARPGGSQLTITIKPCDPSKEPQPPVVQQQQQQLAPAVQQRPSINLLPAQQSLQALANGLVQPWPGMTPEQAWAATLLGSMQLQPGIGW